MKELSLEEKVIFTGQVQNPFYYLKNSNGFILTSNHEGQPMVLLECLALNVPIIATDIAGNSSVLGDILPQSLVDNDEVSISNKIVSQYQTMESSECGYDITTYKKHAMDKFYKYVIGENF
ncbi:glycosyltransferase [Lactococcus garvieae]|uniref:glycosyltransferase n=1 Tax=Lactococcus garvieae TaxID=1363 RepID=UPI001A8E8FD9|nr:glycosyltransferase [Lactococcus garvieae]QSQ99661.1 glycosyltransferase [Lactococcus garvieae]